MDVDCYLFLNNIVINISHNNNNDRFDQSVTTNNMYSNGNTIWFAQTNQTNEIY